MRARLQGDIASPRQVNRIPVVVHIVHLPEDSIPTYGSSNPTDFQIHRAIEWINQAFRDTLNFQMGPMHSNAVNHARNNDGSIVSLDVDTYIEFALAQSDPDSFPTTGILRDSSHRSSFNILDTCRNPDGVIVPLEHCLKEDSWDSKKYFNIWLVNSICEINNENCEMEGFSYGGSMSGKALDGLVLEAQFFDTTERKITKAVHNIGHYLGLYDTYLLGCENTGTDSSNSCLVSGDKVCDTPPDNSMDLGNCLTGTTANTCSNDALEQGSKYDLDVEDLFENFMDGGEPACKNSFTKGQQARMLQTLLIARSLLTSSHGLQNYVTDLGIERIDHPGPLLCGTRVSPVVVVKNNGNRFIRNARIKFIIDKQIHDDQVRELNLAPGQEVSIPIPPRGNLYSEVYHYEFKILEVNGREGDAVPANNKKGGSFVTVSPSLSISNFPYCVDFDAGIPNAWIRANLDGLVNFELFDNYPKCTEEHGPGYLMYNSSGLWKNGQGIGAAPKGTRDYFVSPILDFTKEKHAILTFDFAHKLIGPNNELVLKAWVVRGCDALPVKVFEARGDELETSTSLPNPNLIGWEPKTCEEWKQFRINLDTFVSTPFRIYFEAELNGAFTQNFYLDNICLEKEVVCDIPKRIPYEPGIYIPNTFCTDSLGWTHYYTTKSSAAGGSENLLLFSIRPTNPDNPVFIPPLEAQVILTPMRDSAGHELRGRAPYAENLKGWNVMSRYLRITEAGQPEDSFVVRYYYDEVDFSDMQRSISPNVMDGHERLIFFSIQADKDVDPIGGHQSIADSDFVQFRHKSLPGPRSWTGEQHPDGFFFADFVVDQAYGIGGGTGGYGKGYGARYPVGPKTFDAVQTGASIFVSWVTKREYRTSSFEVYYSRDSLNFLPLKGPIQAGFYGSDIPYGVNQEDLQYGPYYYYVKVIHEDGLELTTDTLKVLYDPRNWINVFPNPSDGMLNVKLNTEVDTDISFAVYDGAGYRKLISFDWQHQSNDPVRLDISSLPNGIFFYVIRFGNLEYRDKLVKLK